MALDIDFLNTLAARCSLRIAAMGPIENFALSLDAIARFDSWLEQGFAGEMSYLSTRSGQNRCPTKLFGGYQSLIAFTLRYPASTKDHEPPPGFGRVARYAFGRDYHKVFPALMKLFVRELELETGQSVQVRILSDSNPLLERELVRGSSIGFLGKNTLFIVPGEGSFHLLGELVLGAEIELPTEKGVAPDRPGCGSCIRCLNSCPTGALSLARPGVLDASRCISYLTIEKRGMLSEGERAMLGDWLFGCDICQEVCPFNHSKLNHSKLRSLAVVESPEIALIPRAAQLIEGLYNRTNGPFLNLESLLEIRSDDDYCERFRGTALMRAKRSGLLRNACCVAVNRSETQLRSILQRVARVDSCEIIRHHAFWATQALEQIEGRG